jgi:hypothetical protein
MRLWANAIPRAAAAAAAVEACRRRLEREVRANLVYRDFTRVGSAKVPDARTMGRWGVAVGPQVLERVHARMEAIAQRSSHSPAGRPVGPCCADAVDRPSQTPHFAPGSS